MLAYDMPLFRPPSEGDNLIIQATLGCSFNRCTFCSMYKTKTYQARPLAEVGRDIAAARRAWPTAHRVFLADGDALALPTDHLRALLDHLASAFPDLQRVSCYATPLNLNRKSAEELRDLRDHGLRLVYVGVESGSDAILKRIVKGATQDSIVSALEAARAADIKVSATVIAADPAPLPQPGDRLRCVIVALDGTWHRPFTTLELAVLQSLVDPDEDLPVLAGRADAGWRERIGNAVPPAAAAAIAGVIGRARLGAWAGESFALSALPIWVRPAAVAVAVEVP